MPDCSGAMTTPVPVPSALSSTPWTPPHGPRILGPLPHLPAVCSLCPLSSVHLQCPHQVIGFSLRTSLRSAPLWVPSALGQTPALTSGPASANASGTPTSVLPTARCRGPLCGVLPAQVPQHPGSTHKDLRLQPPPLPEDSAPRCAAPQPVRSLLPLVLSPPHLAPGSPTPQSLPQHSPGLLFRRLIPLFPHPTGSPTRLPLRLQLSGPCSWAPRRACPALSALSSQPSPGCRHNCIITAAWPVCCDR